MKKSQTPNQKASKEQEKQTPSHSNSQPIFAHATRKDPDFRKRAIDNLYQDEDGVYRWYQVIVIGRRDPLTVHMLDSVGGVGVGLPYKELSGRTVEEAIQRAREAWGDQDLKLTKD